MTGELLALLMLCGVIGVLMLGYPVAFTLAGTALATAALGWALGAFDPSVCHLFVCAPRRGPTIPRTAHQRHLSKTELTGM